jgi:hypothetical protein
MLRYTYEYISYLVHFSLCNVSIEFIPPSNIYSHSWISIFKYKDFGKFVTPFLHIRNIKNNNENITLMKFSKRLSNFSLWERESSEPEEFSHPVGHVRTAVGWTVSDGLNPGGCKRFSILHNRP